MMYFNYHFLLLKRSLLGILVLTLAACGNEGGSNAHSGQSIVRVNDTEITVHQVNNLLQTSKVAAADKLEASQKIVNGLVDQALLVEAAKKMNLDRSPNVMTAIEAAKKKILAQAYIQQKIANTPKPTESEVLAYLKDNPNVFENRKVYAMEELSFKVNADHMQSLETLSDEAKELAEVIAWLNARNIEYKRKKAIHAAERLPKKLLEKMSVLNKGELIFVNSPDKIVVGKLIDTRKQPVSMEQSRPYIEAALMNQSRQLAAKKELERLKNIAKIEYLDPKYQLNAKMPESLAVESKKTTKSEQEEMSAQVEKGLSGL